MKAGSKITVSGLAWDCGHGIRAVEVSTDGGQSWSAAALGSDLGRYAFRTWRFDLTVARGSMTVTVNATNAIGQTQATALLFSRAGYHNNVVQSVRLDAE